jgi:predicted amidohydrolase
MIMDKVIVSSIQFAYKSIKTFEDFAKNVEDLLRQTKESQFVVFPETFTFELLYLLPNYDLSRIPEFTDNYVELFSELSREHDQYIVAGSHLVIEGDIEYNMSHLFSPDGTIFKHRKTHLFPLEKQMGVIPGDTLEIFKSEFGTFGIAICYEMEFPEVIRILT